MGLKAKRIKREMLDIKMFKEIKFGDTSYFNKCNRDKLKEVVYMRRFIGKSDWVAKGFVEKVLYEKIFLGETVKYEDSSLKCFFAKDYDVLDSISESDLAVGKVVRPNPTKLIKHDISVETSEYTLFINSNSIKVNTMANGQVGVALEVYAENKLVGLIFNIGFGRNPYENVLTDCKYLFGIK